MLESKMLCWVTSWMSTKWEQGFHECISNKIQYQWVDSMCRDGLVCTVYAILKKRLNHKYTSQLSCLSAFMISKTHRVAQKLWRGQLNIEVFSSKIPFCLSCSDLHVCSTIISQARKYILFDGWEGDMARVWPYFHEPQASENTAQECNIQPYCLLTVS